jgi:DNA-binding XRE family transcriptional regulator
MEHPKLSAHDMKLIRLAYAAGHYSQAELGKIYGVRKHTIYKIVREH